MTTAGRTLTTVMTTPILTLGTAAVNPVEVQGIVKLGEIYQNPSDALLDPQTKFWQDGQEIPVEAVPTELLTADKVAVLDADGTLHVLIAPKITGTQEAIDVLSPLIDEVDQFGTTTIPYPG